MKELSTSRQARILWSAMLLIFVEVAFFQNGSIFLVLLGIGLLYYAMNKTKRTRKIYIWTSLILIGISILSMWSLRLVIFCVAMYLLVRLWKGEDWQQELPLGGQVDRSPFHNRFFAAQSTPIQAYEWKDIHIQSLAGDLFIDATQTVLPRKTSLISIRQGFGKVKIILPYEVPVRIYYNTILGDARFFTSAKQRIWNGAVHTESGYPADGKTEMIITVTTWMGDVEVIRR